MIFRQMCGQISAKVRHLAIRFLGAEQDFGHVGLKSEICGRFLSMWSKAWTQHFGLIFLVAGRVMGISVHLQAEFAECIVGLNPKFETRNCWQEIGGFRARLQHLPQVLSALLPYRTKGQTDFHLRGWWWLGKGLDRWTAFKLT